MDQPSARVAKWVSASLSTIDAVTAQRHRQILESHKSQPTHDSTAPSSSSMYLCAYSHPRSILKRLVKSPFTSTITPQCFFCERDDHNPYFMFINVGMVRLKCCVCELDRAAPQLFGIGNVGFYSPFDLLPKMVDLNDGVRVMERMATGDWLPPTYLLLIDVSYPAISSGSVATAARTLLETLDQIPSKRNKASMIVIDTSRHLSSLPAASLEPGISVVADIEEATFSTPSAFLTDLTEARPIIEALVSRSIDMFNDINVVREAGPGGPVFSFGVKLLLF